MSGVGVSIIVPVRNGAEFMEECVSFILAQDYSDYEVVFVIDTGSTDGTLDIARELAGKFQRCKVVEQSKDLKLGDNRNIGLNEAEGQAVWFLDVDDAPSPHFLSEMHSLLESTGSEFVCCNFQNVGPSGFVKESAGKQYHKKVYDREGALKARNDEIFPVSVWSKLFRRDFLLKNNIVFDDSFAEDIIYTYRCIKACTRVCIYDKPLYAYRQTTNSICRKKENIDNRGRDEIRSYDLVDLLFPDNAELLRKDAIMKLRSSGHMSYHSFMEYAKSKKNRESYEKYLKGSFEAWWHLHLSSLYFVAIRTYIVLVYKRNGTFAMNKKFW